MLVYLHNNLYYVLIFGSFLSAINRFEDYGSKYVLKAKNIDIWKGFWWTHGSYALGNKTVHDKIAQHNIM